jgi:hypothetical protein
VGTTVVQTNTDESVIHITITPEPTDDERDAVVAALSVLLLALEPAPAPAPTPISRWARTGRIEAMRGIDRRPERGWGRPTHRSALRYVRSLPLQLVSATQRRLPRKGFV